MANAAKMAQYPPVRCMVVGYPGSGKTGALASLVDAGFKLRVLDFDGNLEPLLKFSDPQRLTNVDVVYFEDKLRVTGQFMEPVGIPKAFVSALQMMDHWKYDEDGQQVDLGKSSEWGPDTIVVLDSLTKMGDAAFRRAQKLLGKNPTNTTQQVWGLAMAEQAAFIERLTSTSNRHHVIVLAHLKMISPKDVAKGDEDITVDIKRQIAEIVPTRLFPRALGRELPQQIGGEFPTLLLAEAEHKGNTVRRVLRTVPRPDLDLKLPAPNIPPTLDIADGMLKVFQALSPGSVALVQEQARGALAGKESL